MICDWDARSQEFDSNSMEFFKEIASKKYDVKDKSRLYKYINKYLLYLHNEILGQTFGLLTVLNCDD